MANPAALVLLVLLCAGVSDSICDSGYFRSAKDISSDYSAAARIFSYNLNGTSDSQIKTPFGELLVRFNSCFHQYNQVFCHDCTNKTYLEPEGVLLMCVSLHSHLSFRSSQPSRNLVGPPFLDS